ncbi:hypothetical protein ACPA9J_27650 [Pseudomonas aeruginosa]
MTALVSRAAALESAMSSVGQGIGRLDTGITQSNAQLGQLNTRDVAPGVSTFGTFPRGRRDQRAVVAHRGEHVAGSGRDPEPGPVNQSCWAAAREAASDLDAERAGLARLLGQINPTVAALDRLDDMQQTAHSLQEPAPGRC